MQFLIIEDHELFRQGLKALLLQAMVDCVVIEARDGAEGLEMACAHPDIDVVFIDLEMPGEGGMAAIEEFGRRHPSLPVIVLSASEDPRDVRRAIAAGALGYVPKSSGSKTLLGALNIVLQGDVYVPPLILAEQPKAEESGHVEVAPSDAIMSLTGRQVDVLRLIGRGCSNKEIGNELGLSEKTIKVHISAIFKTLNVGNRTQAANLARLAGIV